MFGIDKEKELKVQKETGIIHNTWNTKGFVLLSQWYEHMVYITENWISCKVIAECTEKL